MRFVDFLRATVLLSGGAATMLGRAHARRRHAQPATTRACSIAAGWWVLATLIGSWIGRRNEVNPPIARLLADARRRGR